MRTPALALSFCLLTLGCTAIDTNGGASNSISVDDSPCPITVDALCGNQGCPRWPLTLSAWCSGNSQFAGPAQKTACDGWTMVHWLDGDQGVDDFYDSQGKLVAVMEWSSNAPCNGACFYHCLAGPPDLRPTQVSDCSLSAGNSVCP
jgi:hypothetical protein